MTGSKQTRSWSFPEAAEKPWIHLRELAEGSPATREQEAFNIGDRAKAEAQTTNEYLGRYPIELLQNAQDACAARAKGGRVWMEVTDSALIVANEGEPFNERRVRALMRYADSPKEADKGEREARTIGFKGIGFSAVFEISDNPQIVSGNLAFQLDRRRAQEELESALATEVSTVPVRGYPFRLEPGDLGPDRRVVQRLRDEGAATVIRLPLREGIDPEAVAQTCHDVLAIETLLFMPALRKLTLGGHITPDTWSRKAGQEIAGGRIHHLRHDGGSQAWLLRSGLHEVDDAGAEALTGTMWEHVAHLNYAVAIPFEGRQPKTGQPGQNLHVYFPTGTRLGRSILIHGDFFVNASRTTLANDPHHRPVNGALRKKTAELLASVLEELCAGGVEDPIGVLAPAGEADQFGVDWWDDLVEAVAERQILPPAVAIREDEDCSGLEPAEAEWLPASSIGPLLFAAMQPSLQRVSPALEHGPAAVVLGHLSVRRLTDTEVASALDPGRSEPDYAAWLFELGQWFLGLNQLTRPTSILRKRPVLKSTVSDDWLAPSSLIVAAGLGARVPKFSARPEARTTRPEDANLLKAFGVPELDLKTAAATVLDDLAALPAPSDGDREDVVRFFTKLWNRDPNALRSACNRLGEIPLPVRDASGSKHGWLRADAVYFGRDWVDDSAPHALYGRIGRTEFLASPAPDNPRTRREHARRFEGFGVASSPRRLPLTDFAPQLTGRWTWSPEFRSAANCGKGHPPDRFETTVPPTCLDRLDTLLESGDVRTLSALRSYLAARTVTIGQELMLRCRGNDDCRRRHRPTKVISIDAWLLANKPWIPILDDRETLVRPESAWTGYTRRSRSLNLQWADLPEPVAEKFGVTQWDRPTALAIDRELKRLQELDPDLHDEVTVRTATQLVRKLAYAVAARTPPPRNAPGFPATQDGHLVWAEHPFVNDLIGVQEVPGLPLLAERVPPRVAQHYRLELASKRVRELPHPTESHDVPHFLDAAWRALTVALLEVEGADLEKAAMAIGRLHEHPCTSLQVELLLDEEPLGDPADRNMLLQRTVSREGSTNRARGDLYWVPPFDVPSFSRYLADYLDEGGRLHLLAGTLTDPEVAREMSGIGAEDLARAAEVLAKYSTPRPSPGDDHIDRTEADDPITNHPDDSETEEDKTEEDDPGKDEADNDSGNQRSHGSGDGSTGGGTNRSEGTGHRGGTGGGGGTGTSGNRNGSGTGSGAGGSARPRPGSRTRAITYVASDDDPIDQEERERRSRNIEIGDAGVDAVIEHERLEGRVPQKMGQTNKGFDVKSVDGEHLRIIEVKATTGAWGGYGVSLTSPEFDMAGEEDVDFWLYVVEYALTRPKIWKIQDPRSRITQFWFDHGWKKLAEEVPRHRP